MALSKIESDSIASTIDLSGISLTLPDGSVTSSKLDTNIAITGNLTVDTNTLYVDSANNRVGIGTSSPAQAFHVAGVIQAGLTGQNGNLYLGGINCSIRSGYAGNVIGIYTNNIEAIRISSAGNIGIGTDNPSYKLHTSAADYTNGLSCRNTNAAEPIVFRQNDDGTCQISNFDNANMTFITNAAERMRITSTGNVGIGTSNPDAKLSVKDTITLLRTSLYHGEEPAIKFQAVQGTGWSDGSSLVISIHGGENADGGDYTERMRIASNGYVGIGTTSPATNLHIAGTSAVIRLEDTDIGAYGGLIQSGAVLYIDADLGNYSGGSIRFRTAGGTEQMRLDSSGNLGIGTSSPSEKLVVTGNLVLDAADSNIKLKSGITGTTGALNWMFNSDSIVYGTISLPYDTRSTTGLLVQTTVNGYPITIDSGNAIIFKEDGDEKMRMDTDGNLAIGTATAGARLRIRGAGSTSATVALRIDDSGGNIMFYVRDDGRIYSGTSSNSPYNLTTASAANMHVASTGILFRSTSSIKYKTDVQDATHGLDDVMKLRPVTYKGKSEEDGDTVFGGLIAEEVHDAGLTEFVQYDDDGNPDALAYGHMVSLAFKAIQEQQDIIKALETRIQALENN